MRLLDLYCGAGGAAEGYRRAADELGIDLEIVGVDIDPQPRYPFTMIQSDALDYVAELVGVSTWDQFDAIHASPPCQAYSTIAKQIRKLGRTQNEHPDLVASTRELLKATGLPYVIENVPTAPLLNPVMLCGSSVGLDLRRHRLFETNWLLMVPPCSHDWQTPRFRSLDHRREGRLASVVGVHGHTNYAGETELREKAMGINWMTPYELTQAIPPAYTHLIGLQLLPLVASASLLNA